MLSQILIKSFAADAQLAGNERLLLACAHSPFQFGDLFLVQGLLAAPVSSPLLGQCNSLALALADQGPFEFGVLRFSAIRRVRA